MTSTAEASASAPASGGETGPCLDLEGPKIRCRIGWRALAQQG